MVKFILIKSPDEWATTKQACRDELVVYLFFFSPIYIYINNSLHLARKYARIFVRGHYLFRVANSFPRA